MSFNLETGLFISNPFLSIIVLILWAYIVKKHYDFSLSLIVVGSFTIQYTEIYFFVWAGSLLLPFILISFLLTANKLINISSGLNALEKRVVVIVTIYFLFHIISEFFSASSMVFLFTKALINIARIYLPFYGVFLLLRKNGALINHIKYNAYISLIICFGYILSIFSNDVLLTDIVSIRSVMFWNMPIGGFSGLALWSLFYFVTKLILGQGDKKIYLYLAIGLPFVVILMSQSRGLLPSMFFGLIAIPSLSKNKVKRLLPALISVFLVLIIANNMNLNIRRDKVSVSDIYSDRFEKNSGSNIITGDSRYELWKEAWGSIIEHPIGGASIISKMGVHSFYLSILMQLGIFGLIYMVLLYRNLKSSINLIYNNIHKVNANNVIIISGVVVSTLSHTLIAGVLGGVDTLVYWSIAMTLVLRNVIIRNMQSQQVIVK